jgi:uncharacterized damage-inducible protein DinB
MTASAWGPPDPREVPEQHHGYVALVPPGDILAALTRQVEETASLLGGLDATAAEYRYAPGKWSVKEIVGHVCDVERVFSYRALWFARNGDGPLSGFEQDDFVACGGFDGRTLASLLEELTTVRRATVSLFRGLDEEVLLRRGIASGDELTVRALAWIIAGHELHHRAVLEQHYL